MLNAGRLREATLRPGAGQEIVSRRLFPSLFRSFGLENSFFGGPLGPGAQTRENSAAAPGGSMIGARDPSLRLKNGSGQDDSLRHED